MVTRNIEAIEYRGKVYVSYDDLRAYLVDLTVRAYDPGAKNVLGHVLGQLAASCRRQSV